MHGPSNTPDGEPVPAPSTTLLLSEEMPFTAYGEAVNLVMNGGPGEVVDQQRQRHEAVQAALATCMKAEGFDYRPEPFEAPDAISLPWTQNSLHLPVLPAERADAERLGYGTDDVESDERAREEGEALSWNGAYLDGLGAQEQAEYVHALTGQFGPDDPDPDGGCFADAEAAAPGPSAPSTPVGEQFLPLIADMTHLVTSVLDGDPRTIELNDEWTSCMLDAGFDLDPPDDAGRRPLSGPLAAYELAVVTAADGSVAWPSNDEATEDIELERRYLLGSAAEHAVAVADHDCRESTRYVERLTEILASLEADFIAAHRHDVDALVEASATD